jgi:carboxymethylenebutenolidase
LANITLTASDGFKLGGWRADPQGKPKGGLVVIQEIFGVNHHVRNLCDRFAAQGYAAVAPAVFDRIQPNFECGYTPAEVEHARTFIPKIDWAKMMLDSRGDRCGQVRRQGRHRRLLHGRQRRLLAACKLDGLACAVVLRRRHRQERRPEAEDADAAAFRRPGPLDLDGRYRTRQGQAPRRGIYVYHAGHGFSCDERGAYDEAAHQ